MRRECDIGRLFSTAATTTTEARIILEEAGIRIANIKDAIPFNLDDALDLLRLSLYRYSDTRVLEAIDAIVNEREEYLDNIYDEELNSFLSEFFICDKAGGEQR